MNDAERLSVLMNMDSTEYMPAEYDKDIFHYTSPEGFKSILFEDENKVTLWASRYDCLNDSSEGKLAEERLREVCEELRDNGELSYELFNLFSSIRTARTTLLHFQDGDSIKIIRSECDRFVCSFSKKRDSLAMWNYYSKGSRYEGFNIGFYSLGLKETLELYFKSAEAVYHIYPVVYDENTQKRHIKDLIVELKDLYTKERAARICYIISNRLLDWGLVFKNECFQHEEEIRVIVDVAKKEDKIPIKYRISLGCIIPYIELKLEKQDVSYVNFGPLQARDMQSEQQIELMKKWLEQNDYFVQVDCSKIPIRF